jgi:hypothetical protein
VIVCRDVACNVPTNLPPFHIQPVCSLLNCSYDEPYQSGAYKKPDPHSCQINPFRKEIVSEKIQKGENEKNIYKTVVFPFQNIFY